MTNSLYLSTSSSSPATTRATATTLAAMIASIRQDLDLPSDPSSSPFGNLPPIKPTSLLDLGLFQTPLPTTATTSSSSSGVSRTAAVTPTIPHPRPTKKQKLRHTIDEALSIISDGGRRSSSSN